jgi:cell division protein ZapE
LFVDHVPLLGAEKRNETKRFINLVDTIYDHRARLFASAAAAPESLLVTRKGTEGFEFDRTVSRLIEIRSTRVSGRPQGPLHHGRDESVTVILTFT